MLRHKDGKRPERTAKIDGYRYILKAVSTDYVAIRTQARDINRANGYKQVIKINEELTYHYWWEDTDKGAPARIKPATSDQVKRWEELTAWRDNELEFLIHKPYMLWVKAE